jgi:hypothetical protein
MSAMGPLFKPQNQDFFVVTNIGGNAAFSDSAKTNNTIQITGESWDQLRMSQPEGTQEMLDAKGMMVMAFEGTSETSPGTIKLDADVVAKAGYKSPEGTRALFVVNSDPTFYKADDYDGNSSSNTAASTATKMDLLGSGWKKNGTPGI